MNLTKEIAATDFKVFAIDHSKHVHCVGCCACIVDPREFVQRSAPVWCIGCRDRIIKNRPLGAPLPWESGWALS